MADPVPGSLRERRRLEVRAELYRAALRLFAERGYDAVTTEQIAAEAGVSHSTLFRHVATKEELLLGPLRRGGAAIVHHLEGRLPTEPPADALAGAILDRTREFVADVDSLKHWRIAILKAPEVLARVTLIEPTDRARLEDLVHQRLQDRTMAGLLVRVFLAASEHAFEEWLRRPAGDEVSLHERTERALAVVREGRWGN